MDDILIILLLVMSFLFIPFVGYALAGWLGVIAWIVGGVAGFIIA